MRSEKCDDPPSFRSFRSRDRGGGHEERIRDWDKRYRTRDSDSNHSARIIIEPSSMSSQSRDDNDTTLMVGHCRTIAFLMGVFCHGFRNSNECDLHRWQFGNGQGSGTGRFVSKAAVEFAW